jgi:hypothetical protein
MTMGDIYFIRLKHESSNKASIRSASNLNVKNLPSKSTLKKEGKLLYSQTPIRLGEMEVTNLMLARRPELVEKLLKTYATNEEARENMIRQLLLPGRDENGHRINPLSMDIDINLEDSHSVSREILEKYINVLGYSIVDNVEENND